MTQQYIEDGAVMSAINGGSDGDIDDGFDAAPYAIGYGRPPLSTPQS